MNIIKNNDPIYSSKAVIIAFDTISIKYPDCRIGNIVVRATAHEYVVKMYALPISGSVIMKQNCYEVKVDKLSGKITSIQRSEEALPYQTNIISEKVISGKQAFEAALDAIKGFENYNKFGKLSIELVDSVYQVTFPLSDVPQSGRGADYAYQVWIDSITNQVVKILVAS